MHKRLITFSLLLLLPAGCTPPPAPPLVPENYRHWHKLTETELNFPIPGHGAQYRIPYINATGEDVTVREDENGHLEYSYPEGTIVLKEIYTGLNPGQNAEKTEPVQLTVMIKDKNHPAQQAGWVWVVKDVPSGTETIFRSEMCLKCHAGANEAHPYGDRNPGGEFRDYLFYPWKDQEATQE